MTRGNGGPCIGLDIGGTKVSAVVVDVEGNILARAWRAHNVDEDVVNASERVAAELMEAFPLTQAIGVAAAGIVDSAEGVLVEAALLKLTNIHLAQVFETRFRVPTFLDNDANATLIAVLRAVGPRPSDVSVLFALGTGVGGALAIGHDIVHGASGYAGELGHMPVVFEAGPPCPCGSYGCLELFASGSYVGRVANERSPVVHSPALRAEDVVLSALSGNRAAQQVLLDVGTSIGKALAQLSALDPTNVFISGSFGHAASSFLIPAIDARLRAQFPFARHRQPPIIAPDPVGPEAAAIGAALLACSRLQQHQTGFTIERNEHD